MRQMWLTEQDVDGLSLESALSCCMAEVSSKAERGCL